MSSINAFTDKTCTRIGHDLGIPEGEPVVCLTLDAGVIGPKFSGYQLEVVGVPPHPGRGSFNVGINVEGETIQVWRVRIKHQDMQAFVEARTSPQWMNFRSLDLLDLDPMTPKDNQSMLNAGMSML